MKIAIITSMLDAGQWRMRCLEHPEIDVTADSLGEASALLNPSITAAGIALEDIEIDHVLEAAMIMRGDDS